MHPATELRPQGLVLPAPGRRVRQATLILAGSLLVAVAAHLSLPLPWTPVPVTLSNMAVLLVGFALGPTAGAAALLLYLLEGACGLPVLSPGAGGLQQLLHSATTGYLLSYPVAAFLAGLLTRRTDRLATLKLTLAATLATALVMLCGFAWLAFTLHLGVHRAFAAGVQPFLFSEVVKIAAAVAFGRALLRFRS